MQVKDFFKQRHFSFGTDDADIQPFEMRISDDEALSQKLKDNVYVFDTKKQANNCSFYLVTIPLSGEDFFKFRRYIWNENEYDLYFATEKGKENIITSLYYAKTNPKEKAFKIAHFSNKSDEAALEKIDKWSFESGAFWLSYANFLGDIKKKTQLVDKKLIEQLKSLKSKLTDELKEKTENDKEIVQALIDRTLFIKFLEDNHIINSFFYKSHFPNYFSIPDSDPDFGYKYLLLRQDITNINLLFEKINALFNNVLFQTPNIEPKFLENNQVLRLIYEAISQVDWNTKELSLFDFRFDVIPTEFISHIYEIFLEGKQKSEGIYYTPDKLAHLVIDDTITGIGTILDPSCGSGMFLVLGFRKLLAKMPFEAKNIIEVIEHRNKLIKDYIYGIEKDSSAVRLSIFSLYLEILKGLLPTEIKRYINEQIVKGDLQPIFKHDLSENILERNALEVVEDNMPHKGKKFDYIVGNPPFLKLEKNAPEMSFINDWQIELNSEIIKARKVIRGMQISQAFMLKIKDWAKPETRFGFVQNSSNFYNEEKKEGSFSNFFFKYYQIESFYELSKVSKVKGFLFRKAEEPVVVTIFTNKPTEDNIIDYYPVEMGLLSKTFDILVIQGDKKIKMSQKDILTEKIVLRDYLIGNAHDLVLINKLSNQRKLSEFLLKDKKYNSFRGLERATNKVVSSFFEMTEKAFNDLSRIKKMELQNTFASTNYLHHTQTKDYPIPFIYNSENITNFQIKFEGYVNEKNITEDYFQRVRNKWIYKGKKILFGRYGNRIKAAYVNQDTFFSTRIYGIKLESSEYYDLFTAIFNSDLVNYYLTQKYLKRIDGNFEKFDLDAIQNIPIPNYLDEDLVTEITNLSKALTKGELIYEGEIKEKLNELIYDLYDLNILEIDRIKDFYNEKKKVEKSDLEAYKIALLKTFRLFFEEMPTIEHYSDVNLSFGLIVVAIYFEKSRVNAKKKLQHLVMEILQNADEPFLAMKEKTYSKDAIYIVKDNTFHHWSTTKAFEDGQEILKQLIR